MNTTPIAFLFPTSDLDPRKVNEAFADQYGAFTSAGYPCALLRDGKVVGNVTGHRVVYRGWMLSTPEYASLIQAIYMAGGQPFTSLGEYLSCHQLPGWYRRVEKWTMRTAFYHAECNIEAELRSLNWDGYFIKDHVKSNNGALGSVAQRPEDAPAIVQELVKYRGAIEGGLCVREYMPVTDERRIFVLNGSVHAPEDTPPMYWNMVDHVAVDLIVAPFYSIDLGTTHQGRTVIVEIGDGQVSDPKGWTTEQFAQVWKVQYPVTP
jgi:hypothetical protein